MKLATRPAFYGRFPRYAAPRAFLFIKMRVRASLPDTFTRTLFFYFFTESRLLPVRR